MMIRIRWITGFGKACALIACLFAINLAGRNATAEGVAAKPATAQPRFALLIGNQSYDAKVGLLKNPKNDVALIAATLKKIGFRQKNVHVVNDADRIKILQALDTFADRVAKAGPGAIAFLYYSGHGAASKRDKRNYLIPVGVKTLDRNVWYQAIALDDVVTKLAERAPNAAHFVIFDACRNLLQLPTKGGKGFVPISERRGMLIAFSTDHGETASDEGQGAGPYATALARELAKPGLHHLDLFQNVKEQVYKATGTQVPWERNGLLQRVYLNDRVESQSSTDNSPTNSTSDPIQERKVSNAILDIIRRKPGISLADLVRPKSQDAKPSKTQPSVPPDNFRLTAPKWKRLRGFHRLSRREAIARLNGNTVVIASKTLGLPDDREHFKPNGIWIRHSYNLPSTASKTGGAHSWSITRLEGRWKIGQHGQVYKEIVKSNEKEKWIKGLQIGSKCGAYLSFNRQTNEYRLTSNAFSYACDYNQNSVRFIPGKHLNP